MPRKKETFLLVSLQEDKAKKLAQIVSNDTSRKILDYLSEKEATESNLAKELNLPISTIHYNLQQLVKGKLVETEEFHYSEKGKEVLHYRLANKFIIIAPKSTFGLKEKLRNILPVGIATAGIAGIIQFVQQYLPGKTVETAAYGVQKTGRGGGELLKEAAVQTADFAEEVVMAAPPEGVKVIIETSIWHSPALWFLIGAVTAIILYLVFSYVFRKK